MPDSERAQRRAAFRPIAVGFVLLALPLWIAVGLADSGAGSWANAAAAAVMTVLGVLLYVRAR